MERYNVTPLGVDRLRVIVQELAVIYPAAKGHCTKGLPVYATGTGTPAEGGDDAFIGGFSAFSSATLWIKMRIW